MLKTVLIVFTFDYYVIKINLKIFDIITLFCTTNKNVASCLRRLVTKSIFSDVFHEFEELQQTERHRHIFMVQSFSKRLTNTTNRKEYTLDLELTILNS